MKSEKIPRKPMGTSHVRVIDSKLLDAKMWIRDSRIVWLKFYFVIVIPPSSPQLLLCCCWELTILFVLASCQSSSGNFNPFETIVEAA